MATKNQAGDRSSSNLWTKDLPEPAQGIVELVHHALLQRDDRVVGDGDVLRANLGTALGDVAQANAVGLLELRHAVLGVERVHLQRGGVNEEARSDEFVVLVMVA